jgi:hypothetical protein
MHRRVLLSAALALLCNGASAQYADIDGKFQSSVTTLELVPLDPEVGLIAASTTVVLGQCSGTVSGIGKMAGNELKFTPYAKLDAKDVCAVKVAFDKQRKTARIVGENCSAHSGASCGWEGDTIKRVP